MMESARREPIGESTSARSRRSVGFAQTPVLPIVPSIDLSRSSSRWETLVSRLHEAGGVGAVVSPYGPGQTCHLARQRRRRFIVASALFNLQSPGLQAVRTLLVLRRQENGPGAVDEKGAQVGVASLRDGSEPSSHAAGIFAGCEAQEAGKVPAGWESRHLSDEADQGCGGDDSNAWNRIQALDYRDLSGKHPELFFDGKNTRFKIADLKARFRQGEPEGVWNLDVGILEQCPGVGNDVPGTDRNVEAKLAQDSADEIDPRRAIGDPCRAQAVESCESLLRHRLDRYGVNLIVAMGLQQSFGISSVGLVPANVGAYVRGREQADVMAEALELPAPEMSGTASFEHDDGRFPFSEEPQELSPGEAVRFCDFAGMAGDCHLEDVLCQINRDRCRLHVDSSFRVGAWRLWHTGAGLVAGGVHPISEATKRWA